MKNAFAYRVYVDTNILINDFLFRSEGKENSRTAYNALIYLRAKPKVNLYIASFSIIQVVSTLNKAKIKDDAIREELKRIMEKYTVGNFLDTDIKKGIELDSRDIEDSFQYVISQKLKCAYILTDNLKDFKRFKDVVVVNSSKVRKILF